MIKDVLSGRARGEHCSPMSSSCLLFRLSRWFPASAGTTLCFVRYFQCRRLGRVPAILKSWDTSQPTVTSCHACEDGHLVSNAQQVPACAGMTIGLVLFFVFRIHPTTVSADGRRR